MNCLLKQNKSAAVAHREDTNRIDAHTSVVSTQYAANIIYYKCSRNGKIESTAGKKSKIITASFDRKIFPVCRRPPYE